MPIAPQNQVYDYILFRGSDIKDIRVVNNVPPVPNDPAIMQMQLPNQMGQQNFPPQFPPQFPPGHMGGPMAQFGGNQYNAMSGLSGLGVGAAAGQPAPFGQHGQHNKSKQASELNHGLDPEHPSPAVEHREKGADLTKIAYATIDDALSFVFILLLFSSRYSIGFFFLYFDLFGLNFASNIRMLFNNSIKFNE